MDLSSTDSKKILTRRVKNFDGSVTTTTKLKKPKKVKRVIARGKGEHTVGAVITSQLLPFNKVMRKQLNNRGYDTRRVDFKNLIPLYYNEFVSNKENKNSPLVPINSYEFRNNPSFKIKPSDDLNGDLISIHADHFSGVNDIVDSIINVFKSSKDKFNSAQDIGENPNQILTDEEITQAKAAKKVERLLEDKMMGEITLKTSDFITFLKWIIGFWLIWQLIK